MYKKIIIIAALLAASSSFGQDVSQMSTSELNSALQGFIAQKDWTESRPYADELITRLAGPDTKNPSLLNLYYLRAYGYYQEFSKTRVASNIDAAIDDLDKIIEINEANEMVRKAIDLKSTCFEAKGDFKSAADALGILLAAPYVYQFKLSEQIDLIRRIVYSLYAQRAWEGNEKWFSRLLNASNIADDKMISAAALIQGAIAKKDYDEAMKYLPYTTIDAPARYDVALNVSFLNAAKELSDPKVERYAEAAMFYALSYDKERVIKFFEAYKIQEQARLEAMKSKDPENPLIPLVLGRIAMAESQLAGLAKVQEYSSILALGKAINYQATGRMYESYWAYTQMIDAFPNSEQIEEYYFYAFDAASKIEKLDDMVSIGQEYVSKFPKGKFVKNIKFQLALFYFEKEMYDELFTAGADYLESFNGDKTAETIVYLMGSTWLKLGERETLVRSFDSYLRKYTKAAMKDSLHYWIALGSMSLGDYAKSYENFKEVVSNYKDSTYMVDSSYRIGIAAYGNQNPEEAEELFTKFVANYKHSELAGEAEFFLGDLSMAKGDTDSALLHYSLVDEKTSNQEYIDNAYIQSIGIQSESRKFEEVIKLATKYVSKYPDGNVALMQFEIANAMNETGRKGNTLLIYRDVILKYGTDPLLSGADKAIEKYIESYKPTIANLEATNAFLDLALSDKELLNMLVTDPGKRYRYFLENPIIDKDIYLKFKSDESFTVNLFEDIKPLSDLATHYKEQLAMVPAEAPEEFFNKLLEDNKGKNPTLEFRAMMALDKFLKKPIPSKVFTTEDYVLASPATLIWISTLIEKYSLKDAIAAYQYILDNCTDNQYLFEAVLGLANLYTKNKDFENAILAYERLENEFSTNEKAWFATMSYGETLAIAGETTLAIAKFEDIRRNPAWRGEAFAGALYNLGKIAESQNSFEEALNYYDNCAIGHSSFVAYSGKAALAEIKLYQKMGDIDKALETANAYLATASAKSAPEYQDILDLSKTL